MREFMKPHIDIHETQNPQGWSSLRNFTVDTISRKTYLAKLQVCCCAYKNGPSHKNQLGSLVEEDVSQWLIVNEARTTVKACWKYLYIRHKKILNTKCMLRGCSSRIELPTSCHQTHQWLELYPFFSSRGMGSSPDGPLQVICLGYAARDTQCGIRKGMLPHWGNKCKLLESQKALI